MKIQQQQDHMRILGVVPFSLRHTLDCGQAFRWRENSDGSFTGVAFGRPLRIWREEEALCMSAQQDQFEEVWRDYFDLDRDYESLTQSFCIDPFSQNAVAYGRGLRLLRQEPWEALCTFLISQCNNMARIRSIIDTLCRLFGTQVELDGETFFTFPTPERLSALQTADLQSLRAGYRAPYLLSAAQAAVSGSLDWDALRKMTTDDARKQICTLPGVGVKVADCFLLFGLNKLDAFPVDTWMKKAAAFCPGVYQPGSFGKYAGIAQQYIFHYARSVKISKID